MKKKALFVTLASVVALVTIMSFGMTVAAARYGNSTGVASQVQVTVLSDEEVATLVYMREEEKLARDVYLELYDLWGTTEFANIAESEQRHTDTIEFQLDKYGIDDPVTDEDVRGEFVNDDLNALYDELLAKGSLSETDAFKVGVLIEETDIADLEDAIDQTDNLILDRVYANLLRGSGKHLDAFNSLLD